MLSLLLNFPLMKFQLPKQDDGFDYYRNSSQDESRDNQGGGITNHSNGNVHEKEVNLFKKRRWSLNSDNKEKSSFYGAHMMEEQYRSMLGEHIQKYKRRFMGALSSPVQNQVASNSTHKFSLKMPDVDLNSSISEGVGGIIRRSILSKGGVLQVYYVKVLEKGDTYENKSNLLSSETLPKEDEGADDQDALVDSLDAMPDEEEDPE
ncbi:DNA helicase INO80 [Glycine soja]|nr:DNA helicase INO80 [Glycine soja]